MNELILIALLAAMATLIVILLVTRRRGDNGLAIERYFLDLKQEQQELRGRIASIIEASTQAQASLSQTLDRRLKDNSEQTGEQLTALKERLAVIDSAQKNLTELAGQVVSLQDILSNKQARGAFGEIQLNNLVQMVLPPNAYEFQATLSNAKRADCLIKLPNPPGPIVIDSKFPLESFRRLQDAKDETAIKAARRDFAQDIMKHVKDIAEKYIIPNETADSALMFVPSEAIYAELHASLPEVVEKSFRAHVWIVSPTTMMATLNTVRAILKDAKMREQAHLIQKEVSTLMDDIKRLDGRVSSLNKHFSLAQKDIEAITTSKRKIINRGTRIDRLEVGESIEQIEQTSSIPEVNADSTPEIQHSLLEEDN